MIRVALVEDDPDVRSKLCHLIDVTKGLVSAGAYENCEHALLEIDCQQPDVVLLDIGLPGMSGVEGAAIIKRRWPEIEIVMLTVHAEDDVIFESLRNGASGYLLKSATPTDLTGAIHEAVNGGAPMSMAIARKVAESFRMKEPEEPLTRREQEVLGRLKQGCSYQAIADELFVSRETIKFHIKNIYRKLQVRNRVEALFKS